MLLRALLQAREIVVDALEQIRRRLAAVQPGARAARLSATVSSGKISRPSGTCTMPRATILSIDSPATSSPSKRMRPPASGTTPEMQFSVVVLPAPFAPSRQTIWPAETVSDTPRAHGSRRSSPRCSRAQAWAPLPEIGFDHLRVAADLRRRPFGDLFAEIEHRDAVRDRHDELHHVLDQHDRDALRAREVDQQRVERRDLAVAQAGRRLVEQQQLRLRGERAREVEHLLMPEIELLGRRVAIANEAGALEQRVGLGERIALCGGALGGRRERKIAGHARRHSDQHVLQHGQAAAELDVLERARDAACRDAVRRYLQQRLAFEQDVAFGRPVEARDAVEHRRLAGAVRADQRMDRARRHLHRKAVERAQAAEADADVAQREQGFAHQRDPRRPVMKPQMPRGMNMTARIRISP